MNSTAFSRLKGWNNAAPWQYCCSLFWSVLTGLWKKMWVQFPVKRKKITCNYWLDFIWNLVGVEILFGRHEHRKLNLFLICITTRRSAGIKQTMHNIGFPKIDNVLFWSTTVHFVEEGRSALGKLLGLDWGFCWVLLSTLTDNS